MLKLALDGIISFSTKLLEIVEGLGIFSVITCYLFCYSYLLLI